MDHRACYHYKTRRGLAEYQAWADVRFVKPHPQYDAKAIEDDAVLVVLFPMHEIKPNGKRLLCGVQRLYLRQDGSKAGMGRKMLGKQVIWILPGMVPSSKRTVILGEGAESVPSIHHAMGMAAVVAYNANHLASYTERLAAQLHGTTQEVRSFS